MKTKIAVLAAMLIAGSAFGQTTTHSVTLTWTPTTSTASTYGYNVYRGTATGAEAATPISPLTSPNGVTCTATLCTYVDSAATDATTAPALVAGTTYYYYVKTVDLSNTTNISPASNEASAMIPIVVTIPNPPTNLKITISQ